MASYEALKASVDKNGEVMVRLDTGEKIELHKHNVKFENTTKEIVVDAVPKHIGLVLIEYPITGYTKRALKKNNPSMIISMMNLQSLSIIATKILI